MLEGCLDRVRSARERIRVVEQVLQQPSLDGWARCSPELELAVRDVARLEDDLRGAVALDPELRGAVREEVMGLKRDLRRMNTLATTAAGHYEVWSRMLGIALAGYASDGRTVAFRTPAQLSIQG